MMRISDSQDCRKSDDRVWCIPVGLPISRRKALWHSSTIFGRPGPYRSSQLCTAAMKEAQHAVSTYALSQLLRDHLEFVPVVIQDRMECIFDLQGGVIDGHGREHAFRNVSDLLNEAWCHHKDQACRRPHEEVLARPGILSWCVRHWLGRCGEEVDSSPSAVRGPRSAYLIVTVPHHF